MSNLLKGSNLHFVGSQEATNIYELRSGQFLNRYFILSGSGTRKLLASPEVVGYDSCLSMLPETVAALRYLVSSGMSGDFDILTILRGGLNYPVEEACYKTGIRVRDMHFLSCERIIENNVITGLDIKYEKLRVTRDRVLVIGDIIATGDTLRLCLLHVLDRFRRKGGSIRKIIFFTVGGTRAISLMEEMTVRIRSIFPGFEGFECFFYEGIFTVYEDKGATGINVPDIDFGWNGGVISPDFRKYIMERPDALLEKCIIYDGGARRYEIPVHFEEVMDYWEGILSWADHIDPVALVGEKLGYQRPLTFDRWLSVNHYKELDPRPLMSLWAAEQEFLKGAYSLSLADLAERRIKAIKSILQQYEQ